MKLVPKQMEFLANTELFAGMKTAEMDALLGCLGARFVRYERGDTVVSAGEPIDSIFLLLSGSAKIVRYDSDGARRVQGELVPGDCFGDVIVCAELTNTDTAMETSERSLVLVVKYQRVVTTCSAACQFHTRLIQNLMKVIARHSREQSLQLEVLSRRTTRDKLMHYLMLQSRGRFDVPFRVPFTREELSTYLYVERSALSREISKLVAEGLIATPRRSEFMLVRPKVAKNRSRAAASQIQK